MTLQLTADLESRLISAASTTGRTVDEVAEQAVREYLLYAEALTREVQDAEQEADRDGWLTSDQASSRLGLALKQTA